MKIELSKVEAAIITESLSIAISKYNNMVKYNNGFYNASEIAAIKVKAMKAQTVLNGIDKKMGAE